MRKILLTLLFVCFSGQALWAQGPWMRAKGKYYTQASFSMIPNYNALYVDGDKKFPLSRELSDRTLSLYGEYGLMDNLTLKVAIPFKMLKSGDLVENVTDDIAATDEGTLNGLGNVELGLSRELMRGKKFILSVHTLAKLPVAAPEDDDFTGLATGYDAFTWQNGLSTGASFGKLYAYLYGGYGFRTNDYSNYLDFNGEVGYQIRDKMFVALNTQMMKSMEDGDVELPLAQTLTGLYANDQEFFAGTLKFFAGFGEHFGATVGLTAFNLTGNNVARQGVMSFGITYEVK